MPSSDTASRAREFIGALDLPSPPVRPRGPARDGPDGAATADAAALAVGQTLVEFGPGADPELRAAITDALLLAQLAADKADADTPDLWYEKHRSVLGQLGFRSAGLTRTAQDFASTDGTLHEAILPVITAAFAGAALPVIVIETLRQLSEVSADQPWLTLFERDSHRFDARQFQIGLVEGSGSQQSVTLLGFVMDLARTETQLLFFRSARDSLAVERLEGRFTIEAATLAALAPDLSAKLADRRRSYLAALEI